MNANFLLTTFLATLLSFTWCSAQTNSTTGGFLGTFTLQTAKYDGKQTTEKPQTASVVYTLTDQKIALTFEQSSLLQKMHLVYDMSAQTITNYSTGANSPKKATVITMSNESLYQAPERATASAVNPTLSIEPTEEVKMISGYLCKKYRLETAKYEVTLWATDKLHIDIAQLMAYMGANPTNYEAHTIAYLNGQAGTALELEMVHKVTKDRFTLSVQDIQNSVGHAIFDLSGYAVQDMTVPASR